MKRVSKRWLLWMIPLVSFGAACKSSSSPSMTGGAGGGARSSADGGAGTGATVCPRSGVVTPTLRDVERDAEGISYAAFGEYPAREPNWARAADVRKLLGTVWDSAKAECPGLPKDAVASVDAALQTLDTAIPKQQQDVAARAGNDIHMQMGPIFQYFHPIVPLEIVRMDATFLRAGVDAHFGDWTAYEEHRTSLQTDWDALKATAMSKVPTCHRVAGTQTVVGDLDDSLGKMKAAADAKDMATAEQESDAGLLEVDILELLFDCPADAVVPKTGIGSTCNGDADCEKGEVCDLADRGGLCAPDPTTTNTGEPCATTIDCGNDPRDACNNEPGDGYPGGYCVMEPCDDVQVCSPGATCVALPFETPACLKSCSADNDCRKSEGYVCQLFPTTPPNGFGPSDHACAFACMKDEDCTQPLKCKVSTGVCTP